MQAPPCDSFDAWRSVFKSADAVHVGSLGEGPEPVDARGVSLVKVTGVSGILPVPRQPLGTTFFLSFFWHF